METQIRIYTINRGTGFVDQAVQRQHRADQCQVRRSRGWRLGESAPNEFVWVRTFDNDEQLKVCDNSPERAAYTSEAGPHIAKIEVRNVEDRLVRNGRSDETSERRDKFIHCFTRIAAGNRQSTSPGKDTRR